MRKKKNDLENYDMINISNKEQEILESYNEEFIEYNGTVDYDDEEFDYKEEIITVEETKPKKQETASVKEEIVIIEEDEETESTIEDTEETIDEINEEIVEEENVEETEEVEEYKEVKKQPNYKKIINIVFAIVVAILVMITIDVISVGRYGKGPYFAIPVKEYNDGGTKEYLGFGYKVIKYNQIIGRRGSEIGGLNLTYNTEPIDLQDLDLAIEITDNEEATYKKYYKKFVRIESTLESMDVEKNKIVFGYNDEGGKYTLKFKCDMASATEELVNINVNEKVYVIGTVEGYEFKTENNPATLTLNNCFAAK